MRTYLLMLLILLAPVLAIAEEPAVSDEAEIRDALKLFFRTVYTGSHEEIATQFAGTQEELVSIKIFNGFCTTSSRYYASCKKRWPNDKIPENPNPERAAEKILLTIGKPRIIGGNQASFDRPSTPTLSKESNKWKVASLRPLSEWEPLDIMLFAGQKAMGSIVGDIDSGKFDSYEEMKLEQDKRINKAVEEIKTKYEEAREKAKFSGFDGTFSSGDISIEMHRAADNTYSGTLTRPGFSFELKAKETEGGLSGSIKRGDETYAFTANLHDGNRLFISMPDGGSPTTLARKIPKPNLLEK